MRLAALLLTVASLSAADLETRLASLMETAPSAMVGVQVVNLATGKTVISRNRAQLFLPGSNMKLFTAAMALNRLGPEYRFETKLMRDPSGALVLVGGGDPSLSARVYPYDPKAPPRPPLQAIEALVDEAIAAGLTRVDGDVIGDDQRYPWSPYPESWTADDIRRDFGAPVSALAIDENAVSIAVLPGARGESPRIEVTPAFEYFTIQNRAATAAGSGDSIVLTPVPGSREIIVTGSIGVNAAAHRRSVAVDDPALFAAHAVYDTLQRRGIPVHGRPVARHRIVTPYTVPDGQTLATRRSPPFIELLQAMVKESQNLHAEMFLREVSLKLRGQGTTNDGLRETRTFLEELMIPENGWRSEDGSGLARNDMVTPDAVTRLLTAMDSVSGWHSLLPVGGQEGTLSDRLCCIAEPAIIRAKTGTLNRAVALSGYAESPANGRLVFSILVNNFAAPPAEVRGWVDRVASALVE
jgi:D-alanyl-D-alanine carboxypeptidase/D-alanyl-D-alanine-endopeptidase (penicillin-binding protein 4)